MAKNAVEQETQPELLRTETLADEGAAVDRAECPLPSACADSSVRPAMPDFMARLRSIYGDKVNEVSGAEIVRWDRDRY